MILAAIFSSILSLSHQIDRCSEACNGVVVVADEETIYFQKAFGEADRGSHEPLSIMHQFCIGSLTKQMTAALVLKEIERGSFSLTDSLAHLLPDLQESWASQVTVHHLLNHTSGIMARGQSLAFEPGAQFAYSNMGYVLLGLILERTQKKSCVDIFQELFEDLEMHSSMLFGGAIPTLLCQGYEEEANGTLRPVELFVDSSKASSGMISNALDVRKWITALFRGDVITSLDLMVTASSVRKHRYSETLGYGYGVQILQDEGLLEISHSGYVPGFISTLLYYPESKVSVIIFENTSWLTDDMQRCFIWHDKIRKVVRKYLYPERFKNWNLTKLAPGIWIRR